MNQRNPTRLAEVIVLGAAMLAVAASVLPWYRRAIAEGGVVEVDAWAAGLESRLAVVWLITAAVVVVIGGATTDRRAAIWCWPAVLGLSIFSLACLMTRWLDWSGWADDPLIDGPDDSVVSAHTNALGPSLHDSTGPQLGFYLVVLAVLITMTTAYLTHRAAPEPNVHPNPP